VTDPAQNDRLVDHSYDGIQEYDNPMPRWWVTVFWLTIVFSILYYVNPMGMGRGHGMMADYNADMAAFRALHPQNTGGGDPVQLLAAAKKPFEVSQGKILFSAKCAACHAADGGGAIGPNLTDNAWLHGGAIDSIYATVSNGVLAKGMPAWGKLLKPDELEEVVAYVWTLRGTTPAKPKEPQGEVRSP
jgi:cytochrome c oxidase cbb3-type subunit III